MSTPSLPFSELVETSLQVARRGGRLDKIAALGDLLGRVGEVEIPEAVAMLAGELPTGRIGVGWATLQASLEAQPAAMASLTLAEVMTALREVASTTGKGSAGKRRERLGELFSRATTSERDFLARLLIGELRQGALEGVMLDAVSRVSGIPLAELRRAAMVAGDISLVARAVLHEGPPALERFRVELFRPIQPMLAQPIEDIEAAVAELTAGGATLAVELKIDGARVQVHRAGEHVRVFSRRLNEVTESVPEVVEAALALPLREVILDGEAFAVRENGRIHPFQTTMRRFGRKLDVDALRRDLPLRVLFFDCLYLDGESLLELGAQERYERLAERAPEQHLIPRIVTAELEEARAFLAEALAEGHEGVMAKALQAPYAAGSRGKAWLKVKSAHTLDLVVLAAEWGHGRRRGKLSNLHLGARDGATGGFVMLGKTFKGLTDELLAWQTERLLELETERDGITVFVRPELVVEVAFNDIQASPHYPAGMALRFARVKGYRPDKAAGEADTVGEVRRIFAASLHGGPGEDRGAAD